jgi:hypothetical protein
MGRVCNSKRCRKIIDAPTTANKKGKCPIRDLAFASLKNDANLEPADLSWVNHLQERDSSKEVTMSDHSKRISFKLKYTADKKKTIQEKST